MTRINATWITPTSLKLLIAIAIACCASFSHAQKASLILHPTQLFLSEDERNQSVRVINNGDATGVFEVSWVDYVMKPDGGFEEWREENPAEWSLQDKVRYSPRRVTLAPGESQNIKIMIKRKVDAPASEYYSHLKVIIATANLDEEVEEEITPNATSIEVKTRSGISVPVIWRNPKVDPKASMPTANFTWPNETLNLQLNRESGVSTRGYIHVMRNSANGKSIIEPIHTVIYPSVDHRQVNIPLASNGVKKGDTLYIVYSEAQDSTSPEITRYELQL